MLAVSELPTLTPLWTRKEEFVMAAETELTTYYDTTTHKLRRHGLTLRRLRAVPNARA